MPFAAALVSVLLAQTATGRYDADGAPRWLDAGFAPVLVVVQGSGNEGGAVWITGLDAGTSKTLPSGAVLPDMIVGADSLGFSIGGSTRVNQAGRTYYWAAVGDLALIASGRYPGDGLNVLRFIPTAMRTPDLVVSVPLDIAEVGVLSEGTLPNGNLLSGGKDLGLVGFADGGYVVTRAGETNRAGVNYAWLAFRALRATLDLAPYTGTGMARSIGPLGFAPQWVVIGRQPGTNSMVHRPASVSSTDDASLLFNLSAPVPNQITALEPSGFRLGTDARVNGGGQAYFYFAFGPGLDAGGDAGADAGFDAGAVDAGPADAGAPDAGAPDAGGPDAGGRDAGEPDAGGPDAGGPDAGEPDAGRADAGAPDAGGGGAAELGVGCGCATVPAGWLVLLVVALPARRRRPQGGTSMAGRPITFARKTASCHGRSDRCIIVPPGRE